MGDMVFLTPVTWDMVMVVMDSPSSPHPPPLHPQLPMPERSVMLKPSLRLMLMPLLKLIMVITVTLDTTVDTVDIVDTMVDTVDTTAVDTDMEDTVTDGANREIHTTQNFDLERKKK